MVKMMNNDDYYSIMQHKIEINSSLLDTEIDIFFELWVTLMLDRHYLCLFFGDILHQVQKCPALCMAELTEPYLCMLQKTPA